MTDETAGTVEVRLTVPEMDCTSCARKVGGSLDRVAGVVETQLSPTSGVATVVYDPKRADEATVVTAIEAAGYDVVGGEGDPDDEGESDSDGGPTVAPPTAVWTSPRAIKTWVGTVFLVAGLLVEFALTGFDVEVATVLSASITLADAAFLVAVVTSGIPVLRGGYYSARNRSLDIDLLMGVAIVAATGIGYFVEAATLAVLFSVAELMETDAMDRARDSLRELVELAPDEATVVTDDGTEVRPVDDVAPGEVVAVSPGGKVPLDGVVVEGTSAVDESPITGESVPVDKAPGDEVYAGSIVAEGYLEVEVTARAADSTLAKVIELVQGAEAKQTKTEQFVDRFAGYYTPVVVALAVLTAAVPPLLISTPITLDVAGAAVVLPAGWRGWFVRGLTLLVIACPCAFVISTPVSVVSGITSAARNGVLVKGGRHLEAMGRVDTVAVDKTGTLTEGELAVTDIVPAAGYDEDELLALAAALERRSEHPIAEAVGEYAASTGVSELSVSDFKSMPGEGVRATVAWPGDDEGGAGEDEAPRTYYAGNPELFADIGVDLSAGDPAVSDGGETLGEGANGSPGETAAATAPGVEQTVADLAAGGKTVVLVGTEREVVGAIAVADELRPEAAPAVERLHELGIERVVMLTGDNEATARAVAGAVGVDEYRASLLPAEKVTAVEDLGREGGVVMVGDGINDAPALAAADVGVAMGAAGTDTAIETADVALMGDDLGTVPYLYSLSHTANGVIRQNIWASLGVKALLAVGVPLGFVSVAVAVVVGDMGMSLGVTGNAMRLSRIRPDRLDD
ncbi:cadmium-transporting ATPase [Halobacteriales archaeon QS_5_68_33]|nr:MAG: cadmium-transporting ATPase [Halobacteriales archaeon QS_5_68_33]